MAAIAITTMDIITVMIATMMGVAAGIDTITTITGKKVIALAENPVSRGALHAAARQGRIGAAPRAVLVRDQSVRETTKAAETGVQAWAVPVFRGRIA
jgi:hypothetical protein